MNVSLRLDQGTVYGTRYYVVKSESDSWPNWPEVVEWCVATCGHTVGSIWADSHLTPIPMQRWYMNDSKFWFRHEEDRMMFVLRWS